MRSGSTLPPRDYIGSGEWPRGRLRSSAPRSVFVVQEFVVRVVGECETRGIGVRQLARVAEVSSGTLSRVLTGQSLCDIGTLARIEAALGRALWPGPTEI